VRAYVDHAFGTWKLNRVAIQAAEGNARSRAVPERLGFREEGTLREVERVGDRRLDGVVYAMLAADWPGA
jgi:ribosomal-protein-serine acetyltransferase